MNTLSSALPLPSRLAGGGGSRRSYLLCLLFVAGMGGLLAGIDYGIIAGALLYLDKTIPMTPAQQGFMVSIYVFGGVIASLFAGALADVLGRKKMMLLGGLMFVVSIGLIFISSGYVALLLGRILMGLSGGVVCVVVPLYMAECLPAESRGRGTSVFQLLLTLGFVLAALIATHFAAVHEAAVNAALGDPDKVFAADDSAWRHIFLTACIPGVLFTVAAMLVSESPRWLFRRHRADEARRILRFTRSEERPPSRSARCRNAVDKRRPGRLRRGAAKAARCFSASMSCRLSSPASCWRATRPPGSAQSWPMRRRFSRAPA